MARKSLGAVVLACMFHIVMMIAVVVAAMLVAGWIVGRPGHPGLAAKLRRRLEASRRMAASKAK